MICSLQNLGEQNSQTDNINQTLANNTSLFISTRFRETITSLRTTNLFYFSFLYNMIYLPDIGGRNSRDVSASSIPADDDDVGDLPVIQKDEISYVWRGGGSFMFGGGLLIYLLGSLPFY